METTVEDLCNVMNRCQFLPADQLRDLRQRWTREAGTAAGRADHFAAWLVSQGVATEYQVGVLSRGNGSKLFVGPYRILERVGRGRLAGVYKATHTSGAVVGIKILPPSKAAQPNLLARFQRELGLAVSVRHPNVIRTYHGGENKGLHYLVMEHLDGETLEDVLARRKRLPVGEPAGVVHQALLGLQAIHEQGLVHRDLRPGNLMIVGGRPDSTAGAVVKILDLGMGRALFDDEGSPGFDLTRPGEMLGALVPVRLLRDWRLTATSGLPLTANASCIASTVGNRFAVGDVSGTVRFADLSFSNPKLLPGIKLHKQAVLALAYNPKTKQLISGGTDKGIKVTLLLAGSKTGKAEPKTATGHAVSGDGKYFASGSKDRTVRVWDLATRKQIHKFTEEDEVRGVAFAPDGKTVYSAGKTLRAWTLAEAKEPKEEEKP